MAKRISFAQKLDKVMEFYHIRKLTLAEAQQYNPEPQEINKVNELYHQFKGFVMQAETKYPSKTPFQKITQSQYPGTRSGVEFFITEVVYPCINKL